MTTTHGTWPAVVVGAQMFSALAWITVAHHFWPSMWRVVQGKSTNGWDSLGCWAWGVGMLETAVVIWWIIYGGNIVYGLPFIALAMRTGLWLLSAGLAVGILHSRRSPDHGVALTRARWGMAAWLGVGLACATVSLWFA